MEAPSSARFLRTGRNSIVGSAPLHELLRSGCGIAGPGFRSEFVHASTRTRKRGRYGTQIAAVVVELYGSDAIHSHAAVGQNGVEAHCCLTQRSHGRII